MKTPLEGQCNVCPEFNGTAAICQRPDEEFITVAKSGQLNKT